MWGDTVKVRFFLCLLVFLLICSLSLSALADNRDLIVYYAVGSSSAYRYHASANCSSLSRSTVGEITLYEAASGGYTPCTRCHPPTPDFEVSATPRPETESTGSVIPWPSHTPRPSPSPTPRPSSTPRPTLTPALSSPVSNASSRSVDYPGIIIGGAILSYLTYVFSWGVREKIQKRKEADAARLKVLQIAVEHQKNVEQEDLKRKEEQHQRDVAARKKYEALKKEKEEEYRIQEAARLERKKHLEEEMLRRSGEDRKKACAEPKPKSKPKASPLSEIPPDCYVGDDNLPASYIGDEKWGEGFTFYMTSQGRAYHLKSCKIVKAHKAHPVNVYDAITGYRWYNGPHYFQPCSYCKPVPPDLSWFVRYKELMNIKNTYDTHEPDAYSHIRPW
ncbi:MAG: hypothetical protein IJV51_04440 [Oscillospiraceae bacterium]|nr:hypothetical protein [Oscillospiraceae bacterium]